MTYADREKERAWRRANYAANREARCHSFSSLSYWRWMWGAVLVISGPLLLMAALFLIGWLNRSELHPRR